FGLTAVSALLVSQQGLLRLVGGLFLCYLGVRTLLTRPADHAAHAGARASSARLPRRSGSRWRTRRRSSPSWPSLRLGPRGSREVAGCDLSRRRRLPGLRALVAPVERGRRRRPVTLEPGRPSLGQPGLGACAPGLRGDGARVALRPKVTAARSPPGSRSRW